MKRSIFLKIFGVICASAGVGILAYVFYPILIYEVDSQNKFFRYLSPVPDGEELVFVSDEEVDYTKVRNWFEEDLAGGEERRSGIQFYTMSIPSLGIVDATVSIGGEDLAESLIQYPGTALPGKRGNAVVFGHSILPQFFNPKDYVTIFSTLPTLEEGDIISVEYDSISYQYKVEDMFEVRPTDIQILAQDTSGAFMTLVTCVPPGHPLRPKRLIVRSRLVPLSDRMLTDGEDR